jgi:hypothetical protein
VKWRDTIEPMYFSGPDIQMLRGSAFMDISVGIVTGCGLDARSSIPGRGETSLFYPASRPRGRGSSSCGVNSCLFSSSGARPAFYKWVSIFLSLGVKLQELEADHSPPTSAGVKEVRIYTSSPPYVFMA